MAKITSERMLMITAVIRRFEVCAQISAPVVRSVLVVEFHCEVAGIGVEESMLYPITGAMLKTATREMIPIATPMIASIMP